MPLIQSNSIDSHGLCFICVSVNVEDNASADKHMVAARQDTISNLCLCDHLSLLIPLFPSLYPSFIFLFLSSQPSPIFPLYSALFCSPNSISHSCPPSYPPSCLNPCIWKFLYFPENHKVVTGHASGREQRHSVYILLSCPSLVRLTHQLQSVSLNFCSFLSLSFFGLPAWLNWSAMSGRLENQRGDNDEWDLYFILFSSVIVSVCRIKVRPSPIPWLPNGAMPALKVSRLVRLM